MKISRKIQRKNARKEKKMRKNMFNNNKRKSLSNEINDEQKADKTNNNKLKNTVKFSSNHQQMDHNRSKKNKTKKKELSFRDKRLIRNEQIQIKRYERKLRLNKRKKKGTLPKSFHMDGLAYVLDVVDNTNIYNDDSDDNNHRNDDNDDNNDDNNHPNDDNNYHKVQTNHQDYSSEHSDQDFDSDDEMEEIQVNDSSQESGSDFNDEDEDNEISDSDNDSNDDKETIKEPPSHKLKEDIYGFLRDSAGKIVKEEKDSEKPSVVCKAIDINQQLLRQIRGALNRLTVNNMLTISSQIEEIFKQNSKHEVNEALWSCINSSLIDLDYGAPNKLTSEVSILIAILHETISEEIGGYAIHTLVTKFDHFIKQIDHLSDSKKIDNLVLVILNLYVCGLIESVLIYDLITKLCDTFNEKCIELINLTLKSVGFILRKDNPVKMKELILKVQNLALNVDKNSLSGSRIGFVLDSLIAIKNNNMSKVKGYGTVVQVELIENTLKSTIKKVRVNSIPGKYDAVLQSSHWYSYTQNIETISLDKTDSNLTGINHEINDRLLKALRLNTPLRKTIFMALSTCNDYMDAAQRLISIGKKQFSEVINVVLHVAIHEKHYNPFYLHLFQHLSKCDRKYKVALDFSIRDKISELESLETTERNVLAQLIFHLFKLNVLAITCLKVVHFTDMNQTYVQFIKRIITPILNEDEEVIQQILSKIPNKDSFATAIRLFISCFIDAKYRNKVNIKQLQLKHK